MESQEMMKNNIQNPNHHVMSIGIPKFQYLEEAARTWRIRDKPSDLFKHYKSKHKISVKRINYLENYKAGIERRETDISDQFIRMIPAALDNNDTSGKLITYVIDPLRPQYYYIMDTPLGICIIQIERQRYSYPVAYQSDFHIAKKTKTRVGENQMQEVDPISTISILHRTFDSYFKPKTHWEHRRKLIQEKPFLCFHCGKEFFTSIMFGVHEQTHMVRPPPDFSPKPPKPFVYQCSYCDQCFDTQKIYFRHQKTHANDKIIQYSYQCKYCDKGFSKSQNLLKHEEMHNGEKLFKCYKCKKKFANRNSFLLHSETHKGKKSYQCSNCDEYFSQVSYLIYHQRMHMWQKPYQCKYCDKCFIQSRSLEYHQVLHAYGILPFH